MDLEKYTQQGNTDPEGQTQHFLSHVWILASKSQIYIFLLETFRK